MENIISFSVSNRKIIIVSIAAFLGVVFMVTVSLISKAYLSKFEELKQSSNIAEEFDASGESGVPVLPSVVSARAHISEQVEYGDSVLSSITNLEDEYVAGAVRGYEAYRERLFLPLPYELVEPVDGSAYLDGVVYRPASQVGDLTRYQEDELIRVKRERLDGFHSIVAEVQRRSVTPLESRPLEDEAYLNDLAKELPFYVPPIVVGNACGGSNTLGCYYMTGEIEITPLALGYNGGRDECLLLATIAHETRHYQQFEEWGNKDHVIAELEEDAGQFMRDNTPERCRMVPVDTN